MQDCGYTLALSLFDNYGETTCVKTTQSITQAHSCLSWHVCFSEFYGQEVKMSGSGWLEKENDNGPNLCFIQCLGAEGDKKDGAGI